MRYAYPRTLRSVTHWEPSLDVGGCTCGSPACRWCGGSTAQQHFPSPYERDVTAPMMPRVVTLPLGTLPRRDAAVREAWRCAPRGTWSDA